MPLFLFSLVQNRQDDSIPRSHKIYTEVLWGNCLKWSLGVYVSSRKKKYQASVYRIDFDSNFISHCKKA